MTKKDHPLVLTNDSMKFFLIILEFYIYSNIHVALSVWSMSMITGRYFSIDTSSTSLFLALSTFVSYNGIRFLKFKTELLRKEINSWFSHHLKLLIGLILISIIKIIELVAQLSLVELGILFPFVAFTMLYMIPIIKIKGHSYSLRKIPRFKIFCISISWVGLVAFFPLAKSSLHIGFEEIIFFIQQFVFILVLTLPFDIRDMNFDPKELKTIPIVLGVYKTKLLAIVLLLAMNIISFSFFNYREFIVMFFVSFLLGVLVLNSRRKQSKYYASFWIEGIPILWLLLSYVFDFIA